MISQSRWEDLINITTGVLLIHNYGLEKPVTKEELDVIVSVLKNNTPFRVVPDHLVSNNNQQVGNNNVVLETKNFSVLGDKE